MARTGKVAALAWLLALALAHLQTTSAMSRRVTHAEQVAEYATANPKRLDVTILCLRTESTARV